MNSYLLAMIFSCFTLSLSKYLLKYINTICQICLVFMYVYDFRYWITHIYLGKTIPPSYNALWLPLVLCFCEGPHEIPQFQDSMSIGAVPIHGRQPSVELPCHF